MFAKIYFYGIMKTNTSLVKALVFLTTLTFIFQACESGTETNNTIDTTSQNFLWEKLTFGDYSSQLFDVAIIDENNIWAVGEINTEETGKFDSNGVWVQPYNAVHWDGNSWELKRVLFEYQDNLMFSPIYSVIAFDSNDIWFSAGVHWNGKKFETMSVDIQFQSQVYSMWGSSSENLYIVGNDGNIAHYNGNEWIKLKSGTDLNINDIYGSYNSLNDTFEIIAVASNELQGAKSSILKIEGTQVMSLSYSPIEHNLSSVWFLPNEMYYVTGDGIYQKNHLSNQLWENTPLKITEYSINKIRGNNVNDVVGVGGFGEVIHFNGKNWKSFFDETNINGNYYSVDIEGDLIVAVGQNQQFGALTIGRRVK